MANAPKYDRSVMFADAMLVAIERELSGVTAFTRDDLMGLTTFAHVATITRYAYVGQALRHAVDSKKLLKVNRLEYIRTGTKKAYTQSFNAAVEYHPTIMSLIEQLGHDAVISVYNLLSLWTTDHHLSTSIKRTLLRDALREFTNEGKLESTSFNEYKLNPTWRSVA